MTENSDDNVNEAVVGDYNWHRSAVMKDTCLIFKKDYVIAHCRDEAIAQQLVTALNTMPRLAAAVVTMRQLGGYGPELVDEFGLDVADG